MSLDSSPTASSTGPSSVPVAVEEAIAETLRELQHAGPHVQELLGIIASQSCYEVAVGLRFVPTAESSRALQGYLRMALAERGWHVVRVRRIGYTLRFAVASHAAIAR